METREESELVFSDLRPSGSECGNRDSRFQLTRIERNNTDLASQQGESGAFVFSRNMEAWFQNHANAFFVRSNVAYSTTEVFRLVRFQYRYPGTPISTIAVPQKASVGRVMIVFSVHAAPMST